MQFEATIRYPFTMVGMAVVKKTANGKCWGECGGKGTLCTAGGTADWGSQYRTQYGDFFSKNKK